MTAFNLHIHFLNLRGRLEQVYTQDRLKITGFLGIFMALAGFIGKFLIQIKIQFVTFHTYLL